MVLLTQLANLFDELQRKVDGIIDFAETAPAIIAPLDSLLAHLGLTTGGNQDLDNLVRSAFPDPAQAVDALHRLPGLLQSLADQVPATGSGPDLGCSRGRADIPPAFGLLVAGQRVVVCR